MGNAANQEAIEREVDGRPDGENTKSEVKIGLATSECELSLPFQQRFPWGDLNSKPISTPCPRLG